MIRVLAVIVLVLFALPVRAGVEVQVVTSPGGIRAWLVEEHSIPFIALDAEFKGGTSLDLPGKRGATYLMSGLLEEGAGEMDAAAFARAAQSLAAEFNFDVSRDSLSVSARFLTENRDASVALLRTALTRPRFDADAIERVRGQVLSIIDSNRRDQTEIAVAAFNAAVFGDHPYGSPEEGTPQSVAALTRDDLVAAHRNLLARDRLFVAVVGDITAEELGPMLDTLFGELPATGAPLPPKVTPRITPGVQVIDYPSPQSVAIFGAAGIERTDPDFFPAFVMNYILGGGGFASRLTEEVREKRGLTYGVGTSLVVRDLAPLIMGSVRSANDRIAQALEVIRAEWGRMAAEGVTEEELQKAKDYLTGEYPLRFDGNGRIAAILAAMQLDGLGVDYIATRNDRVRAVTREDIARVARRLLHPEGLQIVVVGQPKGL